MKALMYHYVRPDIPLLPYFRNLHIDDFKQQLDYLSDKYRILNKQELRESLRSGMPVENGIVLTFDDGLKDHFEYVYTELKRRNLWGIFYIPTLPYMSGKMLDVHRIHLLIGKCGGKVIFEAINSILSDDMLSHEHVKEFREMTYESLKQDEFTAYVKRTLNYYIGYEYRESLIDALMIKFFDNKKHIIDEFYLSKEEIAVMHRNGMTIGSHSVNHPVMSKLTICQQQTEIESSFQLIEDITGALDMKTFCYPYGGFHSFTKETENLLEQNECEFSFNVENRDIESKDLINRRQALPRYDCNMFPYGSCRNI